jgi:hypothetical protein
MAMTLRLTDEQEAHLTALSEREGVSKQQAVVMAIDEAYSRRAHKTEVNEAFAFALTRYANVIDRLGK